MRAVHHHSAYGGPAMLRHYTTGQTCETCGDPAVRACEEGGSIPPKLLCAACAALWERATAVPEWVRRAQSNRLVGKDMTRA